jgi:ABC-type transport system involved in cytochrome bd biosynthesis fused ATPase/permease subunit
MKKSRLIFYLLFALFHLGAFIFTIALGNDTSFLMSMFSWVPYFKWVTLLGLFMVCVDFIWAWIANRDRDRQRDALAHEVNTLKAKLFDMQEEATKRVTAKPLDPPTPPSAQ